MDVPGWVTQNFALWFLHLQNKGRTYCAFYEEVFCGYNDMVTIKAFCKVERNVETDSHVITMFIGIKDNTKPAAFLILLLLDTPPPTYLFRFLKQKHKLGWKSIPFLEIIPSLTGWMAFLLSLQPSFLGGEFKVWSGKDKGLETAPPHPSPELIWRTNPSSRLDLAPSYNLKWNLASSIDWTASWCTVVHMLYVDTMLELSPFPQLPS